MLVRWFQRSRSSAIRAIPGVLALVIISGAYAQTPQEAPAGNPGDTLVQSANREAKAFVDSGNLLLTRHAALEAEFERGSAAIEKACKAQQPPGVVSNNPTQSRAPLSVDRASQLPLDRAAKLSASLERLRSELAEQNRRRCSGGFRLPGQRSDTCVVLDMATEWGNQAQSFLIRHRETLERSEGLRQDLSRLSRMGCLSPQQNEALLGQHAAMWGYLSRDSAALLEAAMERLKALGGGTR